MNAVMLSMRLAVLPMTEMMRIVHDRGHLDYRRGSGNSYEIFDIEVANECRRAGVGRAMVNRLIKVCEAEGVKHIYAITRAENRIAQQFYEEQNFRSTPIYDFYGVKTEEGHTTVDAILYARNLETHP